MALTELSRSISGKVAVVTGAASGMGEATAKLFADEGARVAAIDLNEEPLARVVGEIEADGKPVRGWVLDLGGCGCHRKRFSPRSPPTSAASTSW